MRPAAHNISGAGCWRRRWAFSLLEVLAVLAILAVLSALLYGAMSGAERSAREGESRAWLRQLALAVQAYRAEYGRWPTAAAATVELNATPTTALFWAEVLTGSALSGGEPTLAEARAANPRRLRFLSLAGAGAASGDFVWRDALGNPQVGLALDLDGDGVIPGSALPGGVAVQAPVVAFCLNPGHDPAWAQLTSWP